MINLMFAGNGRIFDGLLTSALSVVKYCKSPLTVYILTMDLREENPDFFPVSAAQADFLEEIYKSANKESKVRVIDCTEVYKRHFNRSANEKNQYTPYATLRLLSDLINGLPDKILYLDADVLAMKDIELLYETDVKDFEFAAARDYYGRFFIGGNYINSGVLLMNMQKIKSTGLFLKARKICTEEKMMFPDQTAINRSAISFKILPMRFNEQHKEKPDTVIRHFSKEIRWLPVMHTRNIKPWQVSLMHDKLKNRLHDDVLNEYLIKKELFLKKEQAAATQEK